MPIVAKIIAAGEVADAVTKISNALPRNASEFKDKWRPLWITVRNETQFEIKLRDEYFDSGRNWDTFNYIAPFSEGVIQVCNKDTSLGAGVSGGKAFNIGGFLSFSIGFSNPAVGSYKISVISGNNAKGAYERIKDTASSFTTSAEKGVDAYGNKAKVKFDFLANPGAGARVTISQIRVR